MQRLIAAWRSLFDIRPGEYRRTVFMSLYLMFVLFSYYVLKSASESMFLNRFDIDKLANLYILMAVFGGALAYVYSKVAARTSLNTAVTGTIFISVACLLAMWYPLRSRNSTMVYVFAVWVRMFSIVTVTQGWVVASNLFNAREAKRVYGLLGLGMVVGAIFGGEFTTQVVHIIGTGNLLFASAPLVLIAYACYLVAVSKRSQVVTAAKATAPEEAEFSFRDIAADIARSRHLQVLIMIMTMQFMVDTLIDYQFKDMAKGAFHGDALTAFLGRFYGRYLNISELALQLFFTTAIVRRLGVGGTLQVMPVSLAAASLFTFAAPSVVSASLARLVEASTRYTLARTGNELFYMPLPLALRNRIKAFIDIFVDRAARGVSGGVLLLCTQLSIGVRGIAMLTIGVTVPWILLTIRAHHEYVRTIRKRLEARRLDIDSARIRVEDADTVRLLEDAAVSANPRQAAYALSLLGESPGYQIRPLLLALSVSPMDELRSEVYRVARAHAIADLVERAMDEIQAGTLSPAAQEATVYLLTTAPNRAALAKSFLENPHPAIQEGVVEALTAQPELTAGIITTEWISRAVSDPDPHRRVMAARLVAARGDQGTEAIHHLLTDPDPHVAQAACRAAARLRNREYLFGIVRLLASYRVRGIAIESLAEYGEAISGTLGDLMGDRTLPLAVRSTIPRVLRRIPHQRSVDVLLEAYQHGEHAVRIAALKALARLREKAPELTFHSPFLKSDVLQECRRYFELSAALAAFDDVRNRPHSTASLLARTVEERRQYTMERLFRLLALEYPAQEMHWAHAALAGGDHDRRSTAVEYLDNVLDQDYKRVILPIFDAPERLLERGKTLFGVEAHDQATIIRGFLDSDEPWLAACAMAAAAELHLRILAGNIRQAALRANPEVLEVAQSALAALG